MTIFDHIKHMHEEGLHKDLVQLLNIIIPQCEAIGTLFSQQQQFQAQVIYGDSFYECCDYQPAEHSYLKALEIHKDMMKNKKRSQSSTNVTQTAEFDLRYKLFLCKYKQSEYKDALKHLLEIQGRQKPSVKIHMAMGDIYMRLQDHEKAITCYKEVLLQSPLSIQAISNLIELGFSHEDIINTVMTGLADVPNIDWLPVLIRSKAFLNTRQASKSVSLMKQLEGKIYLKGSSEISIILGQALYYNGLYKKAIPIFKKAFCIDGLLLRGVDFYAACLWYESEIKDLEMLSNQMLSRCETNEKSPEPWIALSYYCFAVNKKDPKALHFAQKAAVLSGNSVESLLLKGYVLMESRKLKDAIRCFREANEKSPFRYEPFKYLADAQILDNNREAANKTLHAAIKELGETSRTLTLFAGIMISESQKPNEKKQAKLALEKAIKLDPGYLPAVTALVLNYNEENNYDKSIEILMRALEYENNQEIHRLLGECYSHKNENEKALHHFNVATKFDVTYRTTSEASQRLQHQSSQSSSSSSARNNTETLILEVDEIDSDNDIEDSDTEVVWSDGDY